MFVVCECKPKFQSSQIFPHTTGTLALLFAVIIKKPQHIVTDIYITLIIKCIELIGKPFTKIFIIQDFLLQFFFN